jgi:hypothetical protein
VQTKLNAFRRPALLIFLIGALIGFLQLDGLSQYVGPLSAISIDFVKGPSLSDSELMSVIKLAQKAGVKNVTRIHTYYIHPSPEAGIAVLGAEIVNGRNITFPSVNIRTEGLTEELSRNFTNVLLWEGKYWVERWGVETNTLTLFEMKGQKIRVKLDKKVPLGQADRVIAALSAGKVSFADAKTKREAEDVNLSKPIAIYVGRRDGSVGLLFSCGEWCDVSFYCVLERDNVVLTYGVRSES